MFWKGVATAAFLVQDALAQNVNVGRLLRFSCSQLVIERTDPIVQPGVNPSSHTHQIVGGNSFNVTVGFSSPHESDGADSHRPDGSREYGPIHYVNLYNLHILRRLQQLLDRQLVFQVSREWLVQDGASKDKFRRH